MRYSILSAVLLALTITPAIAGVPYNVDDPGTTEPLATQVNIQYMSSQLRGSETQAFPSVGITYGVNNNTEADLSFGAASTRQSGTKRATDWSDTLVGVRWRFQEETKSRPQVGLAYFLKLPTASPSLGLGSGVADHQVYTMAAKSFGPYMVMADAGYNFVGSNTGKSNCLCGCAVTRQVSPTLNLGAQLYGNSATAPGAPGEFAWGVGGTYNYAPDRTFLVGAGRSMRGFSDCNVYVGWMLTFEPHKKATDEQSTAATPTTTDQSKS